MNNVSQSCSSNDNDIKVVVPAEILPRDFLQTLENYFLSLTLIKIQRLKNFTIKKFHQFLKALTMKLSKQPKQPYYLKSSVHVNVPLILKAD